MQDIVAPLRIRVHNDRAFMANVNGHKMDYLNPETEAIKRQITRQHAEQERADITAKMRQELKNNDRS